MHGLVSIRISCKNKPFFLFIPNSTGKFTLKMVHKIKSPSLVCCCNYRRTCIILNLKSFIFKIFYRAEFHNIKKPAQKVPRQGYRIYRVQKKFYRKKFYWKRILWQKIILFYDSKSSSSFIFCIIPCQEYWVKSIGSRGVGSGGLVKGVGIT